MGFRVITVLKDRATDKQVAVFVEKDGRRFKLPLSQFEGLRSSIGCDNATFVRSGGYVRGTKGQLQVEYMPVVESKPTVSHAVPITENYVKPWEIDMTQIFADVLETLSKMDLREYLCVRGGVALGLFLANKPDVVRNTVDIDVDFKTWQSWDAFARSCGTVLTNSSRAGYKYEVVSRRNLTNIDGTDTVIVSCDFGASKVKFKIDMNVRVPSGITRTKTGLRVASVYSMLGDKLSVAATEALLDRVKDLYDIYAYSYLRGLRMQGLIDAWYAEHGKQRVDGIFCFNATAKSEIKATYERMERLINKADFQAVLARVAAFGTEFYNMLSVGVKQSTLIWNESRGVWND